MNPKLKKAQSWIIGTAIVLAAILIIGQRIPSDMIGRFTNQRGGAPAYQFPDNVYQIEFTLGPNEATPWIVTPPGSVYRFDSGDKPIQVRFWGDLLFQSLGATDVHWFGDTTRNWYGIRTSVIQVRADKETTQVAVTIERR